eukprot:2763691-Pyramimonas_sp.AAC.1
MQTTMLVLPGAHIPAPKWKRLKSMRRCRAEVDGFPRRGAFGSGFVCLGGYDVGPDSWSFARAGSGVVGAGEGPRHATS